MSFYRATNNLFDSDEEILTQIIGDESDAKAMKKFKSDKVSKSKNVRSKKTPGRKVSKACSNSESDSDSFSLSKKKLQKRSLSLDPEVS